MNTNSIQRIAIFGLVAILAACASKQPAPVTERVAAPSPAPVPEVVPAPAPATLSLPVKEPDPRPEFYTVRRGDTLYSIALEHGLDHRELAAMNNIENANVIRVGQLLRVRPATATTASASQGNGGGSTVTPMSAPPALGEARPLAPPPGTPGGLLKTQPKAIKLPYNDQALAQVAKMSAPALAVEPKAEPRTEIKAEARPEEKPETRPVLSAPIKTDTKLESKSEAKPVPPAPSPMPGVEEDHLDWIWPTSGPVIAPFSETANLKGFDIGGKLGQPVVASAAGRVVYAGSGLRGYGKLIIIKHNKTFLSAYAHNKEILIKEGDVVAKGQRIAELGNTDTDGPKLHFEIRRFGKPVDPARYLPAAPAT